MFPIASLQRIAFKIFLTVVIFQPAVTRYAFSQGNFFLPSVAGSYSFRPLALTGKVFPFSTVFGGLETETPGSFYSISLCADVPDNDNPSRVHVKNETGHVFLLFSKFDPFVDRDTVYSSFGFYPRRPVSTVLFRNARSLILGNDKREYNASVTIDLSLDQFRMLLTRADELSGKKYNINTYNCYDYALEVFNSIPGIEKLPVNHMKFPFIFGHGGSPCCLYADLKKLKESGAPLAENIRMGLFASPVSIRKVEE